MSFFQKNNILKSIIVLAALIIPWPALAALPQAILEKINQTTFEIVIKKPEKESLSYERKLPMELIPYQVRNDKYVSVGTAFSIGNNRYLSAAHVFYLELESFYSEYFLRDRNGKVYPVDNVYKYSNRKDFIVFSVKGSPGKGALKFNAKPILNETVYAVGNAYGEGIVIRDGSYTSNTKEERDGLWEWIRFSAAASPGNSGGPLLDKAGNVIGIILRKSANENLNYALPVNEMLKAKNNEARLDSMLGYKIDNMPFTSRDTMIEKIKLPMSYRELSKILVKKTDKFAKGLLNKMFRENDKKIFPKGKGSGLVLTRSTSSIFPRIISRGDDGYWDTYRPKSKSNSDLGNNGFISYGSMDNSLFMRMRKPDNVPLKTFYKDSKIFMDLFLKGVKVTRQVGSENIKIISMGKANKEYIYTDSYNRKWQVRVWSSEYDDRKYTAFCLPVPGGYIAMMRSTKSGRMNSNIDDLEKLTDFINVSYYGTLKEWGQYLVQREIIPPVFANVQIDYKYGKYFKYQSKRLLMSYDAKDMEITEDSDLQLVFSYFKEKNKVVWDVARVVVGASKDKGTFVQVERNVRPPGHINQKYRRKWDNIASQRTPYSKEVYFENKRSFIATVYNKSKNMKQQNIIYTVAYGEDGNVKQSKMQDHLEKIMKNIKVHEARKGL
ncbi:MAG: trypsin-like peptidase domain-containing protein [Proteobacteria bacterium]|nr:trypsin-like peptidase domain-containing protein [Pseudomonadota bacterium]